MRQRVATLVLAALAVSACEHEYVGRTNPTASPPTGRPAAPGIVAAIEPAVRVPEGPCPEARPDENTSCVTLGASCEYGASSDSACTTFLTCGVASSPNGAAYWSSLRPEPCAAFACPQSASIEALDGTSCVEQAAAAGLGHAPGARTDLMCDVEQGLCVCGRLLGEGPADGGAAADGATNVGDGGEAFWRWRCVAAPPAPCPPRRPRAGQPCQVPQACAYGTCLSAGGATMVCVGGRWRFSSAGCL